MSINLTPISGSFGVDGMGVNFAALIPEVDAEAMRVALKDRLAMVVRDEDLTLAQYVESMKVFGNPMHQLLSKLLMPEHPEIAVLDSRIANTKRDDGKVMPIGSRDWHTDHTNHP